MGSPLIPMVTNLLMKHFKKKKTQTYNFKPTWWKRFVDDTLVKWSYDTNELEMFIKHLNFQSKYIKFTMAYKRK
jgi:hypothetical protein